MHKMTLSGSETIRRRGGDGLQDDVTSPWGLPANRASVLGIGGETQRQGLHDICVVPSNGD